MGVSSDVSRMSPVVIPGCATWRRPGIHTHDGGYGFRARDFVAPRNDGGGVLRRADPIAVKAIRHAVAEMHQRDGAGFDILRIEHRKIAAVLPRAPDR